MPPPGLAILNSVVAARVREALMRAKDGKVVKYVQEMMNDVCLNNDNCGGMQTAVAECRNS